MSNEQFLDGVIEIAEKATERYKQGENIEWRRNIPLSDDIPLESNTWLKIEGVTCVYLDMKGSTKLSAQTQDKYTAGMYQYFTDTAVRMLDYFNASYIDVRGDGAFGLFDRKYLYHGLASAITFKTFVEGELAENIPSDKPKVACHIGIDIKTVLVKRIGLRKINGGTSKQNEVWAGKPVNMAAKLASRGGDNEIMVSDRVFKIFSDDGSDLVLKSCGCSSGVPGGDKVDLWKEIGELPTIFDFEKAYLLKSPWCVNCGKDFCLGILKLDK